MSFMPNPGSLVQMESGYYGLVAEVTPDSIGDQIIVFGSTGTFIFFGPTCVNRIARIIYEPPIDRKAPEGRPQ